MGVLREHAQIKLSLYYNSKKPIENQGKLEKIYGFSLADLEKQWIETFTTG